MILEIIERSDVETQEDLARLLKEHGIGVTQATVSRDIKELRLIKVLTDTGAYKYATVDKAEAGLKDRLIRIFGDSVVAVTSSYNLIIIKTLSGSGSAAAEAIDSMHWNEIAGTLAGDNTIFLALKDLKQVPEILKRISAIMRK